MIRLKTEHNRKWKRFILLAWKLSTPWLRLLMLPPHNQVVSRLDDCLTSSQRSLIYIFSCYILSYLRVQNIVSVLVTLWTSVEMTPMKLVYCFALMKIPVHRMSGYQLLTSLPTQLIMDVDSMPLCLAFYPITGGFFVFTPWIKCSFVQGLWCIWNFMYCEKILCPSRLVILRLFFLCPPLCTVKQRNTQKLSLKVSNGYKPFSVRSRSGKRPSPACNGWLSKITLIWTEI